MSSIDFDDALGRSREGPAFSNSTEWECWSPNWCDWCARDAPFRNGISSIGCALILVSLQGRIPAEWIEQPWAQVAGRPDGETAPSLDRYHCVEFRPQGGGGDGEPRPRPEPPDMDGLFPRPERVRRMLKTAPVLSAREHRRIETVRPTVPVL